MIRYFGVLSSHSAVRSEVVPTPRLDPAAHAPPTAPGDQLELLANPDDKPPSTRKRWAWLLKHVFSADLDVSPRCGGVLRWSDAATTTEDIQRLMAAHGLVPQPPPRGPPAPPPGQLGFRFR
ncbi:MAG: hypothetical protein SFV15_26595 [Polyangiaceae bacterium]|nr:hypothetical protein [Polyangiaceae bacterium]